MKTDYSINTDIKFNPLELIDVKKLQIETKDTRTSSSTWSRASS